MAILGERHGLAEPPKTVISLLSGAREGAGFTHLAVEWSIAYQPYIERYLSGEEWILDRMKNEFAKLGVGTEEFWSVFSFVFDHNRRHQDRTIEIRMIDVRPPISLQPWRDRHMFEQVESILAEDGSHRVLVWVGMTHAAKSGKVLSSREGWNGTPVVPMASMLKQGRGDEVVSLYHLARGEPLWEKIKAAGWFEHPVAFAIPPGWPAVGELLSPTTQVEYLPEANSIAGVFDYALRRIVEPRWGSSL